MHACQVIFQNRVRVFHRGFKQEKTDKSTRPQAECFYCFQVFETLMKHGARVLKCDKPRSFVFDVSPKTSKICLFKDVWNPTLQKEGLPIQLT